MVDYLESVGQADEGFEHLPLTQEARGAYLGRYSYGAGPDERLEVYINDRNDLLMVRRPGGTPRVLFYVGDDAFFPTGAAKVRLQFRREDSRVVEMTVLDPEVLVRATRVGS